MDKIEILIHIPLEEFEIYKQFHKEPDIKDFVLSRGYNDILSATISGVILDEE